MTARTYPKNLLSLVSYRTLALSAKRFEVDARHTAIELALINGIAVEFASNLPIQIAHSASNLRVTAIAMKLAALVLCLTASNAFQHLRPAVTHVALRGKTRGDGTEQPEDDGPLDIDAAIDEALKSPSIVDAISEDINAHWEKTTRRRPRR